MEEEMMIEMMYKGRPYHFDARLIVVNNMHKFIVSINRAEVTFEPDVNHKYSVIVVNNADTSQQVDSELIFAVGELIRENYS